MAAIAPHIAVVDDDSSVRQAMQRLIKSLGYDVSTYGTADAFLKSLRMKDASCILLDIQMPGLSGLDLQDIIAALKSPIPIIFITARRDEDIRIRAQERGAVGFLEKPFDDRELIALVEKAIQTSSG
jgi:FixJ family two-component response regulator